MAPLLILHEAFDRGKCRKTPSLHVNDQDHRCIRKIRHFPCAGALRDTAETIVKSHHTLEDRDPARRKPLILQNFPSQQIPQRIRPHKKAVQISRWNLQHRPVKHRVDIIGATLKGAHRLNPLL